ncbi:unnamed protein product [Rhizophagus irregularis]|nr:unnamed protein product [Rhizophagus irregularis]
MPAETYNAGHKSRGGGNFLWRYWGKSNEIIWDMGWDMGFGIWVGLGFGIGMGFWQMGWDMGWDGIGDSPIPFNMGGKYSSVSER